MAKLTKARVKSLVKPGRYPDGRGLYLRVAAGGSKQWVQRIVILGRRRDLGLGGYEDMPLEEVRALAAHNRKLARVYKMDPTTSPSMGPGPIAFGPVTPTPKALTFRQCSEQAYKEKAPHWKTRQQGENWIGSLRNYAFPILGDLPVNQITGQDVLKCLKPIWHTKPDRARTIRQRVRTVLGFALAHGWVSSNAAGDGIDGALPKVRNGGVKNYKALPYGEVAGALKAVDGSRSSDAVKLCFRWTVLTAARPGEAVAAKWSEIDLERKEWRLDAFKMKANKEHRVPLSDAAMEVLRQAQALRDKSGLLFPSPRGRELSNATLNKVMKSIGLHDRAKVHGFRSSFRDWCAETGKARELAEAALAHVVGGVEGAYFRSDLFEQRRTLMQAWAAYLRHKFCLWQLSAKGIRHCTGFRATLPGDTEKPGLK